MKESALLSSTRKLDRYLSKEYGNLVKASDNEHVSRALMESKVKHYNELVEALNQLIQGATGETEELFGYYYMDTDGQVATAPSYSYDAPLNQRDAPAQPSFTLSSPVVPTADTEAPDDHDELRDESPQAVWQQEGYVSEEDWLADKEKAGIETPTDLSVSVDTGLSQYRAGQALSEYRTNSEEDIANHDPESEQPASVMGDDDDSDDRRPTPSDHSEWRRTASGVDVDSDPTQIAGVETAVERDQKEGYHGAVLDPSLFESNSDTHYSDLLDDSDFDFGRESGDDQEDDEDDNHEHEDDESYDEDDESPDRPIL